MFFLYISVAPISCQLIKVNEFCTALDTTAIKNRFLQLIGLAHIGKTEEYTKKTSNLFENMYFWLNQGERERIPEVTHTH